MSSIKGAWKGNKVTGMVSVVMGKKEKWNENWMEIMEEKAGVCW